MTYMTLLISHEPKIIRFEQDAVDLIIEALNAHAKEVAENAEWEKRDELLHISFVFQSYRLRMCDGVNY